VKERNGVVEELSTAQGAKMNLTMNKTSNSDASVSTIKRVVYQGNATFTIHSSYDGDGSLYELLLLSARQKIKSGSSAEVLKTDDTWYNLTGS